MYLLMPCICFFLPTAAVLVVYSTDLWVCDVLFLFLCSIYLLWLVLKMWILLLVCVCWNIDIINMQSLIIHMLITIES